MASKGVYTTLEQGAKISPQSRQWFGRKNQERRNDELLRYISEARNDAEHGVEQGVEFKRQSLSLGVSDKNSSRIMQDQWGNTFINCGTAWTIDGGHPEMKNLPILTPLDGKPIKSVHQPDRIVLKSVMDRSRKVYPPPTTHLKRQIESNSPLEISSLTVKYLEALLEEAKLLSL